MLVAPICGWLLFIHMMSVLLTESSRKGIVNKMERVKSSNRKHDKMLADGYAYNYFRSTKYGSVKTYRCDRFNELHCEAKLRATESTSNYKLVGVHFIDAPIQDVVRPLR
jgi:hypothetical protein